MYIAGIGVSAENYGEPEREKYVIITESKTSVLRLIGFNLLSFIYN